MVDTARQNWLLSLDDGSSEKKKSALEKIYDDFIKLELATATSPVIKEIDRNQLSQCEKIAILENELVLMKNKIHISKMIFDSHGSDCYEDLFRDNIPRLEEIRSGIELSLHYIKENDVWHDTDYVDDDYDDDDDDDEESGEKVDAVNVDEESGEKVDAVNVDEESGEKVDDVNGGDESGEKVDDVNGGDESGEKLDDVNIDDSSVEEFVAQGSIANYYKYLTYKYLTSSRNNSDNKVGSSISL